MAEEEKLTFKTVKYAFILIQKTRSNLTKESAIIERIWYKSKAQHKSAEWFRAIDGVRKCLRRLLDPIKGADHQQQQDVQPRIMKSNEVQSGQAEGEIFCGALDRACSSLVQVWCSYWGKETTENNKSLPKFDGIPKELPNSDALCSAVRDIRELIAIMEELSNRTRIAANSLISHLRTPPAPTFAPITTACLAIMSGLHSEANQCLHGPQDDPPSDSQKSGRSSIKYLYNIMSSSSVPTSEDKGFTLNVGLERKGHQKRKQSSVSQVGKKQRPNETTQNSGMMTQADGTEEDLGEIV
ncbi:uncharacterized protein FA14DRAFT_60322 [Meira miltonrushii]|uniref:Uncharacterized protein n=1 Tax=Meira miltonrushii TaxID=1280837 RepID=A0A316VCK1_9BASI|nr:uncharacterized protein FA14DRAFT_60322 [Meira miltonrushii]PWN33285.1 hypothetical protein FA14DRAFT_60322 [Meira miltonrushii]